ncbi:MAG TPA: ABC transporter permease [Nitrosospira sp.]|nr:ABC transporter permease [Nitrosospira sp.]
MASFVKGWRIQTRVISALMIREVTTRFGRENIGFLWIMVEPLLFAVLVGIMWSYMKGTSEHGISVMAFTVSGYIPLVLFRHAVNRAIGLFKANGALMYHRQIKIMDFVLVRFLIEFIGHMMAYFFIALVLFTFDIFPTPFDIGLMLLGWIYYSVFILALCFILAPLSETSEIMEKLVPVTTYIMIPFSGAFTMMSWMTPAVQDFLWYSPFVHPMEMMRYGIFGNAVSPHFDYAYTPAVSMVCIAFGLSLCRRIRRKLVVE